jgi:hypothetical protein
MGQPTLLAAACIYTFDQKRLLTNASSFFFERDGRPALPGPGLLPH